MPANLIPAAEYLRMSTEHQQYSPQNQSAAIRLYAELHGFIVVKTYSDPARSGVLLKHRSGLRELLKDVAEGKTPYRAILVYDVSRWGRFQDADESAHYEFLCKSAGIPVHYCAEQFANDGSLPSSVMKALKRAMAGEYSRELGVKVWDGQARLAKLGFKQGGPPGYGLRRMLVSATGERKQLLADGERKSIATDRVILVSGTDDEVRVVRDIYEMFVSKRMSVWTACVFRYQEHGSTTLPSIPSSALHRREAQRRWKVLTTIARHRNCRWDRARPRGINDGKAFVFISHLGEVFPSRFLPLSAGNVRQQSLTELYRNSPLFGALRDSSNLKGKCGICEFREVCGGSRARA